MLFKSKNSKTIPTIRNLLSEQKTEDSYILDDENAIIVIKNLNKQINNSDYEMIHERVVDGMPKVVNRWNMKNYYFGYGREIVIMEDFHIFRVQNGRGTFDSLYDYKTGEFIVPQGIWDRISFWEEYNGFLASFKVISDYEKDDVISYINPVTKENMTKSFKEEDGNYYAMLNLDGTIRDNCLYKGRDISKPESRVDLDNYESVIAFQKWAKDFCNQLKNTQKEDYYRMIEKREDGSISPYMDQEVLKTFRKQK